jgi:hypothetical protein
MEVGVDDSGRMISLEYGSPEAGAEFVTWVLTTSYHPMTSASGCSSGGAISPLS